MYKEGKLENHRRACDRFTYHSVHIFLFLRSYNRTPDICLIAAGDNVLRVRGPAHAEELLHTLGVIHLSEMRGK